MLNVLQSHSMIQWIKCIAGINKQDPLRLLLSKTELMECIEASTPDICPAQSCKGPAACWMSAPITDKTTLAIMRLTTSPTPIGLTPGSLPKAISLQARRGATIEGSTNDVHKRWARTAMEQQSSSEADLKLEHVASQRHQHLISDLRPRSRWKSRAKFWNSGWSKVKPTFVLTKVNLTF